MSTFGDVLAGVLLQKIMGQGSQESEQHADGSRLADKAVHPRNPTSAARAPTFVRVTIY